MEPAQPTGCGNRFEIIPITVPTAEGKVIGIKPKPVIGIIL